MGCWCGVRKITLVIVVKNMFCLAEEEISPQKTSIPSTSLLSGAMPQPTRCHQFFSGPKVSKVHTALLTLLDYRIRRNASHATHPRHELSDQLKMFFRQDHKDATISFWFGKGQIPPPPLPPPACKVRILLQAKVVENLFYGCMAWNLNSLRTELRTAHHPFLLCCIGWKESKEEVNDRPMSFASPDQGGNHFKGQYSVRIFHEK